MTELLTFTNGTINDQILGTKVFHSVTSLHITGTPANAAFQVGVYGNSTGTAAGTFDDDALFSSTAATAAGTDGDLARRQRTRAVRRRRRSLDGRTWISLLGV